MSDADAEITQQIDCVYAYRNAVRDDPQRPSEVVDCKSVYYLWLLSPGKQTQPALGRRIVFQEVVDLRYGSNDTIYQRHITV